MYVSRYLEAQVARLSGSYPVVLVTGARQVGKTTMLRSMSEGEAGRPRGYVSLDDFAARSAALDDPGLFLARFQPPLVIDEVQHAPDLLSRLKPLVDAAGPMGRYWLTGSQAFPVMKGVSESLAGRVGILSLGGLSSAEEQRIPLSAAPFRPDRVRGAGQGSVPGRHAGARPSLVDPLALFGRIVRGGMPRLGHDDAPPLESFWGSYVQTYVERDVRALLDVDDLAAFQRFLRLAAARTAQLLNLSDIARDAGTSPSTARKWMNVLEATHQVVLIRPYFSNIGKRQVRTPKLYFADTGLACYLTGFRTAETALSGAMAGALFENHVVSEIAASWRNRGLDPPLWFWRDKEKREVDLLIDEDGMLFPVEIKLASAPARRDARGMEALGRLGARLGRGAVVCLAGEVMPLADGVDAIPVGAIA